MQKCANKCVDNTRFGSIVNKEKVWNIIQEELEDHEDSIQSNRNRIKFNTIVQSNIQNWTGKSNITVLQSVFILYCACLFLRLKEECTSFKNLSKSIPTIHLVQNKNSPTKILAPSLFPILSQLQHHSNTASSS